MTEILKSKKFIFLIVAVLFSLAISIFWIGRHDPSLSRRIPEKPKVYWFVPDGLRADKGPFNIYDWANKGELPNLKKLMDSGCYGYSWPVFPGHTPVNFATMMTGVSPEKHGVTDGTMRFLGSPLNFVASGGFTSFSKLVSPIWVNLENKGYLVSLQSIPGSTPPELFKGNTIKGRWGAWGIDFPSKVFQDKNDKGFLSQIRELNKTVNFGSDLTSFISAVKPVDWKLSIPNFKIDADDVEINLTNWGFPLYGLTQNENVVFSSNKRLPLVTLKVGEWSEWIPVKLIYKLKDEPQSKIKRKSKIEMDLSTTEIDSKMKIKLIRMDHKKSFRVRILYDHLNEFLTQPNYLSGQLHEKIGPMVDFVDNYPPQLIYFPEDKKTLKEEADMSWAWHKSVVPFLTKDLKSEVVIQSIYSPNQMLTSRWWLPFIDPLSHRLNEKTNDERNELWADVKQMYQKMDDIIGEILKNTNQDWYVVLSSDHGVLPLDKEIRLNNLFSQHGWLKYKKNKETGEVEIDWKNTKVVYLQMYSIYINSKNLEGPYVRENSEEYKKLRGEVIELLKELKDPVTHQKVASQIWTYEQAHEASFAEDRVGDIILANSPQYNWTEEVSTDGAVFVSSLKGGYKQGVWPTTAEGMLTPFVIAGPGIKKGCKLSRDINHVDQFATLKNILKFDTAYEVEGRNIDEIFE